MPEYFPNRASAFEKAEELASRYADRVAGFQVELVPYNGWVVVLLPKYIDLTDLLPVAEVRDGVQRENLNRRMPPPMEARKISAPKEAGDPSAAPRGGVTAKVWQICDACAGDRTKIMEACTAAGINKATASTQYSKWKRSKNA